jgi:hypothetical protein
LFGVQAQAKLDRRHRIYATLSSFFGVHRETTFYRKLLRETREKCDNPN